MITFLIVILICWLSYKTLGLLLSLTWGLAKIIGTVLLCLLFAGGLLILLPLGLVFGAFMLGKACG